MLRSLLARLASPQETTIDAGPGEPLFLNGLLYLLTTEGRSVELSGFPSSWFRHVGDSVLLIAPTGSMRLHDAATGTVIDEQQPNAQLIKPCFADHGRSGDVRVYSTWFYGYSACGTRIAGTTVTTQGINAQQNYMVCIDDAVAFGETPDESVSVNDFGDACGPDGIVPDGLETAFPGFNDLQALAQVGSHTVPRERDEAELRQAYHDGYMA